MKAPSLSESMPRIGIGELAANDFQALHDQRLLPRQQRDHLGPARTHVRRHQAPQEGALHRAAAVGDEVDLQITGRRVVPVREGAYGDLLTLLRGGLPLLPARGGAPHRGQQPVDGRRAGRQETLSHRGIEGQMPVPFQGRDEAGQDRLEALATNAIRCFPQDDEGFSHGLVVGPPGDPLRQRVRRDGRGPAVGSRACDGTRPRRRTRPGPWSSPPGPLADNAAAATSSSSVRVGWLIVLCIVCLRRLVTSS